MHCCACENEMHLAPGEFFMGVHLIILSVLYLALWPWM